MIQKKVNGNSKKRRNNIKKEVKKKKKNTHTAKESAEMRMMPSLERDF